MTTPNIIFVRSDYGRYTPQFISGSYVAIGWLESVNLKDVKTRDELYPLYRKDNPDEKSNIVIGQQVGQISRFLHELKTGDYVFTQSVNSDHFHYGILAGGYYYERNSKDGCPFPHRKKVTWIGEMARNQFSVPFQNTIRSSLTIFYVSQAQNFFTVIGKAQLIPSSQKQLDVNYHQTVLTRLMELDAKEFEILITHLLSALGFEGAEHTGRPGDGGVDATGELNVSGLAKIKIVVQAKRHQPNKVIKASDVKTLRQSIPRDSQGAFITTAQFDKHCKDIALDPNFPRIGLINGNQFVDLLAEHWDKIPDEFKEKLNLKLGLVNA
jgi:predicted Mrr-cat superfamily restriction endonuclease